MRKYQIVFWGRHSVTKLMLSKGLVASL